MACGVVRVHLVAILVLASLGLIMAPNGHAQQVPAESGQDTSWIDSSHGYLTQRTNELTRWVDGYFGDTETDQEGASSRLRLRLIADEDQRFGTDFRVRVGGKVNLPRISKRLDLVFRGNDTADDINGQVDPAQSRVGLQYELGDRSDSRHRFDITLGMSSSGPRPGLKYRYYNALSHNNTLRFSQRAQYDLGDGVYYTSRLDLDHKLTDNQLLRSYTRLFYGEDSRGYEWSTSVAHFLRWTPISAGAKTRERATMLFAEVSGVTRPWSYRSNYRLGFRYRHQTARDYLFVELEPSYNWRIDEPGLPRRGAWRIQLRFEFLLFDDLRRDKRKDSNG